MIRERRDEDLDRLCAILEAMDPASSPLSGRRPRDWLQEHDAERSWVFDMAPVRVAPTRNVVAHVQIYRPGDAVPTARLVERAGAPVGGLLAIGKLFVRPDTYEDGIGRFLVRESVGYIRAQGKLPVLDLHENRFFPRSFFEKVGFEEAVPDDPGVASMIYTR